MDSTAHGAHISTATTTMTTRAANPSHRASTRLSTFSITPTLAPSIAPSHLSDENNSPTEKQQQQQSSSHSYSSNNNNNNNNNGATSPLARDMFAVHATLARLDEPRLMNQRYIVSENKKEEISKLALGAKLEKALGRRMSGQDAVFTKDKGKAVKAVKAAAA